MVYKISVTFSLKTGNTVVRYKSDGLYIQGEEPLSKELLIEQAKQKTLAIITRHYPSWYLNSGLKVSIKQIHVNFLI